MKNFTSDHFFTNTGKGYFVNYDFPVQNVEWHAHDFLEFVLISKGIGIHQKNHKHSWSIMQGDIFAVSKGSCHRYESIDDLWVYNIMIQPENFGSKWQEISQLPFMQLLLSDTGKKYHLPTHTRYQAEILMKSIMAENIRKPPGWSLKMDALIYELLVLIGRSPVNVHTENISNKELNAIYKAIIFIENNISDPITVNDICNASQININYFCNAFRNATGTSPWNYMIHLRLEKAKKLLCETDMTIAEVAQESGFCDQSYMSRLFRKYEKITPSQFRNAYYGQKYN